MKRIAAFLLTLCAGLACAQTCTPGGGVTCTPNLNLWLLPYNYQNWNVPVDANASSLDTWSATVLLKAGGTMTGALYLSADPTTSTQAATKNYVDTHISGLSSFSAPSGSWPTWLVPTVTNPTSTPSLAVAAGPIPNSALANPTLTLGATTLTLGATTTAVTGLTIDGVLPAVMAYVDPTSSIQTQLNGKAAKGANSDITSLSGLTTPLTVGQGGTGVATGTGYAYGNGALAFTFSTTIPVASVTGAAPLASPTFTGIPAAPTAAVNTNTTQLATTAFVYSATQFKAYVAVTSTYAIQPTDYQIEATTGTFTVTLPTAVGITGKVYSIKNSGIGTITLATTSSQLIDGNLTQTLTQLDNLVVMSNGTGWIIQ